ncbi:MAG: ABC transporter permease [Dehalococcoidia bacterium]|nr:ABC transporter permease [Dehalococcoidia bacterium]
MRRAVGMVGVVLMVTIMLFLLMSFVPGDPITARYGMDGSSLNAEQEAALRKEYGLDQPLAIQYLSWVRALATGDLGDSIQQRRPVATILRERVPVTLQISGFALLLSIGLAIPLGVVAAVKHNSVWDRLVSGFALAGVAMPAFWLGLLLLILFSVKLSWFPVTGFTRLTTDPLEALRASFLPALTAALGGTTAMILRQLRAGLIDVMRQDYIRTARAKGVRARTVVLRHGVRNAMLPTVTVIGLATAYLLGGSVVIERVFNIPGMGRLIIDAMNARDYPVVQGVVLVITIFVVIINLVTDLTYAYLDPRIRLR